MAILPYYYLKQTTFTSMYKRYIYILLYIPFMFLSHVELSITQLSMTETGRAVCNDFI
jgi:hypothetical protein